MTLRSFVVQALLRAVLVCAAFYVGFIVIDARAQQAPAQTIDPKAASSDGLPTSTHSHHGFGGQQ